jgi:hypothetical protein
MKKIILFLLIGLLYACSVQTDEQVRTEKEKVYFLDEDFTLVDRKEEVSYDNNSNESINIRVWKLHRVKSPYDSVYVGEIISSGKDCGCANSDFYITDELWYNKQIGDNLHFNFIRKDRFFKVDRDNLVYIPKLSPEPTSPVVTEVPETNNLDKDREILEIERQILSLQLKLEKLKE